MRYGAARIAPLLLILLLGCCLHHARVIGPVETVKLVSKDGRETIEVKAKIDTGAYSSSIDESLAIKLGYGDAIEYYRSFGVEGPLTREEVRRLREGGIKERLKKHPDISDAVFVYSANGVTLRIKIPLTFYLDGVRIESEVTVARRSWLKYPMIIGRRDLKGFLVNPSGEVER
ncbi:hypothetical protein DRP77_04920 [Candidatus Poribacteria bacterium]|nr:MAG: hypothetical protein DRP77_04920 [Candidatus Poribacteria bacterium]